MSDNIKCAARLSAASHGTIARSGISTRTNCPAHAVATHVDELLARVPCDARTLTGIGAQTVMGGAGGRSALRVMARAPHSLGTVGPFDVRLDPPDPLLPTTYNEGLAQGLDDPASLAPCALAREASD